MTTLYPTPQPSNIPATSGIYRITCVTNKKIYIGSSINLLQRWQDHRKQLRGNTHANQKLQNAFNKYGEENFIFETIELVLSPFLLEREQYWMDRCKPFGEQGFNIVPIAGSNLGFKHSDESRAKMSARMTGNRMNLGRRHTPEEIEKARIGSTGNTNRRGKTHTPESRAKMSATRTGRKHSEEHKRKIGEAGKGRTISAEGREAIRLAQTGRKHSDETRAKISAAKLGKPSARVGYSPSPETRAKISATKKARYQTSEEA